MLGAVGGGMAVSALLFLATSSGCWALSLARLPSWVRPRSSSKHSAVDASFRFPPLQRLVRQAAGPGQATWSWSTITGRIRRWRRSGLFTKCLLAPGVRRHLADSGACCHILLQARVGPSLAYRRCASSAIERCPEDGALYYTISSTVVADPSLVSSCLDRMLA